jgi:adenine-specific DNA-methyltransferase
VVIGNPPYLMVQPHNTSSSELQYYSATFPVVKFKVDLFHMFFIKGIELTKTSSYLTFIAPSSLLNNVYTEAIRREITSKYKILSISVTEEMVFEDADVHTSVYMFQKKKDELNVTSLYKSYNYQKDNYIAQTKFLRFEGCIWNMNINERNADFLRKINESGERLGDISQINRGLITGDKSKYFSDVKIDDRYIPIIGGKEVLRFIYKEPQTYVLFERPDSAGGCWDSEVHLSKHKTLIRQIGKEPTACYIDRPFAITGNVFSIISDSEVEEKAICCILNSRLMKYFWSMMFYDYKTSFPQITIQSLSSIPIPTNDEIFINLDNLFQEIFSDQYKIENLEAQIDQLVYQLYDLTEEEIAIIENSIK